MSTHDEKQASVGETLVEELSCDIVDAFLPIVSATLGEIADAGKKASRAVLAHLARRGQDEIRGAFPTDEETLRSCDGLSIDALTVLNTKQALEARIVARIGPLLAARHVALADAHGELQRLWATRDERDEIYRELVNVRKAHQDCYLGWNACMKERDAILAARDAALAEARAELERLRGRAIDLEEERDAEVNRAHAHMVKRREAEKSLAAVLALTVEDVAEALWAAETHALGTGGRPFADCHAVVKVGYRRRASGVLSLLRSRAGEPFGAG